jgi:hypothetical protein
MWSVSSASRVASAWISAMSPASLRIAVAAGPMDLAAVSRVAWFWPVMITSAPSRANAVAAASPMPLFAAGDEHGLVEETVHWNAFRRNGLSGPDSRSLWTGQSRRLRKTSLDEAGE